MSNLVTIQLYISPPRSGLHAIYVLFTRHILLYVYVLTYLTEAVQYLIPHVNSHCGKPVENEEKKSLLLLFWHFSL